MNEIRADSCETICFDLNDHNDLENSKNKVLCTLFRQPLENKKILAGVFNKNGEILELFESN